MREYTKPLAFALVGSGKSMNANTRDLLDSFIFGNEDGSVDAKVIVPFTGKVTPFLVNAIKILKNEFGITGEDYTPLVEPQGSHEITSGAAEVIRVAQGEAHAKMFDILTEAHKQGYDTAFISLYDPNSPEDLYLVEEAKNYTWLSTLNLSEGLIDFFEGYESTDDRIKREAAEKEFAEQQAAAAPTPKKAATPRKRVARKKLVAEDSPLVEEPKKPVAAPCIHYFMWFDDQNGKSGMFCKNCGEPDGTDKPVVEVPQAELSGKIVLNKSEVNSDLTPVPIEEVWDNVAKAVPPSDMMLVSRGNMARLGKSMENMAIAFSEAMAVFTEILEEN